MFSQAHPLGDIWVFGFKFLKSAQDQIDQFPQRVQAQLTYVKGRAI